jgi:hypothetical protein
VPRASRLMRSTFHRAACQGPAGWRFFIISNHSTDPAAAAPVLAWPLPLSRRPLSPHAGGELRAVTSSPPF